MKWIIALLLVLMACTAQTEQQAMSKPVVQPQTSAVQNQVLEPEIKAPQDAPQTQVQETTVQQVTQTSNEPRGCTEQCEYTCEQDAFNACKQEDRSRCKANCGSIVDPSACSQACTFLSQPMTCKSQLEQFCKSQCVERCS